MVCETIANINLMAYIKTSNPRFSPGARVVFIPYPGGQGDQTPSLSAIDAFGGLASSRLAVACTGVLLPVSAQWGAALWSGPRSFRLAHERPDKVEAGSWPAFLTTLLRETPPSVDMVDSDKITVCVR